ncbi:MAG: UDP-3-O-(3-hydroxymyristoyl)glucosamine N-acyltransferase [Desulfobacterales bacterium]|jgi:UDP-3-O-[3-hydroxymyristoyl] glucosamine N-acyltransferase|nr:UDP-3-O-(3-hydroxymyristoyl)glucosamine N-acyltransferase [Desulfobacterales bacterium]
MNSSPQSPGTWTLARLAEAAGGVCRGDSGRLIGGAAPFETAGPDDITFAMGPFLKRLNASRAGAFIVPVGTGLQEHDSIEADAPQAAFARILRLLYPRPRPAPGIAATAVIGSCFQCGEAVSIGAQVVIRDGVTLGSGVILHPGVVLGEGVSVGADTEIFPQVTILAGCRIGARVRIQSGTVIGSDGFGYAREGARYLRIPHRGIVQIDDEVEIGAGNTIDRATYGRTWLQRGVKTDNLVHIGHNVIVGENTVIVAQVGISGSVTIGRQVIMAGQAGVAGHLSIGDGATVGPRAGVVRPVAAGEVVSGTPQMPHGQWLRVQRLTPQLPEMARRLRELEKRLKDLESGPPARVPDGGRSPDSQEAP